jgi:hypothetical protein
MPARAQLPQIAMWRRVHPETGGVDRGLHFVAGIHQVITLHSFVFQLCEQGGTQCCFGALNVSPYRFGVIYILGTLNAVPEFVSKNIDVGCCFLRALCGCYVVT